MIEKTWRGKKREEGKSANEAIIFLSMG